MNAKLQWVAMQGDRESVLTCGHVVDGVRPLDAEAWCEQCMWGFIAQLDQEIAAAEDAARQR